MGAFGAGQPAPDPADGPRPFDKPAPLGKLPPLGKPSPFDKPAPNNNAASTEKPVPLDPPKPEAVEPPFITGIYQAVGGTDVYILVGAQDDYELRRLNAAEWWRSLSLLQRGTQSLGQFRRISATQFIGGNGNITLGRLTTIGENARNYTALSVNLTTRNSGRAQRLELVSDEIYGVKR